MDVVQYHSHFAPKSATPSLLVKKKANLNKNITHLTKCNTESTFQLEAEDPHRAGTRQGMQNSQQLR